MSLDYPRSARYVRWTPRLLLFILLLLPLLPGCKGWDYPWSGSEAEDPFFPGGAIPKQGSAPPPQPQPQSPVGTGQPDTPAPSPPSPPPPPPPAQPIGTTSGSTSPDAAKDPRATNTNNPAPKGEANIGWNEVRANGSGNTAPLHGAETAGAISAPAAGASNITQVSAVQAPETIDQAILILEKDYGMIWSELKQDGMKTTAGAPVQFVFNCTFANKQNPKEPYSFDGTITGPDRLTTLRNAIEAIKQKQAVAVAAPPK
jgi:hypothetical protein